MTNLSKHSATASRIQNRSHSDLNVELSARTATMAAELLADSHHQPVLVRMERDRAGVRPLRVMKFGGTSVGDAACIRKVVDIIRKESTEGDVVVVVSAMSGVTNKLVECAISAAEGDRTRVTSNLHDLRAQHNTALKELVHRHVDQARVSQEMSVLFAECERWCEGVALAGRLTPRLRDSISSLGERLSAPLVAAALAAEGIRSEAIEATELLTTNSSHGGADPKMDATRARCEARLLALLQRGTVPVITGFIGATEEGVLTTLGRGGSDYSATILAAALNADEVTIWTDVDGMFTADPHVVPGATTIPEISYHEAAELAHFGARVLHPKTLQPVAQCGIPVRIRNTFAPENAGTKITPTVADGDVNALTAIGNAALITVKCTNALRSPDAIRQKMAASGIDVLLLSGSPAQGSFCLVVSAQVAQKAARALRMEFAAELNHDDVLVDGPVAILTVVGRDRSEVKDITTRAMQELVREHVKTLATGPGVSQFTASFVVPESEMKAALLVTHRELKAERPLHRPRTRLETRLQPTSSTAL